MPVKREGKLNGIEARLENAQKRALIESGMLVAQRARNKAPVLTGRLKRSIAKGMPYIISLWHWAIDVGSNVVYAAVQEFGWPEHNIKAQPYLRPALEESRKEITVLFIKNIVGAFER